IHLVQRKFLRAKQLIARLAREFALDEVDVRGRFKELRRQTVESRKSKVESHAGEPRPSTFDLRPSTLSADETELLEILVLHPELASTALGEIGEIDLTSPTAL